MEQQEKSIGDLSMTEVVERQRSGDKLLKVNFFPKKVYMSFKSKEAGKDIYEKFDFIKIVIPGAKQNINIFPVNDTYKHRFPLQWEAYRIGKEQGSEGTPLDLMPGVGSDHIRLCKDANIDTIEQLLAVPLDALKELGQDAQPMIKIGRQYLKDNVTMEKVDESINDSTESGKEDGAVRKPVKRRRKRK